MTTERETSETKAEASYARSDFLLHMYDQMWGNINRHILVVWQSVGVLLAIPATLALLSTGTISVDVAVSLIFVVCAWLLAHVEDASYWFNRNLAIIANIEAHPQSVWAELSQHGRKEKHPPIPYLGVSSIKGGISGCPFRVSPPP